MAKLNYSKTDLDALIKETQKEVQKLLKSEDGPGDDALAMSEDDKSKGPPKKDDSAPPADDKSSAPPADASAPPADASPAPAADVSSAPVAPPADASAPPAGDPAAAAADPSQVDPAAAGAAAPPDSVESLKAAYAQLAAEPNGAEVLKAHFMALREVIAAQVAASASAAPASAVPGVPAAPPASAVPPAMSASAPMAPAPAAPMAPAAPPMPPEAALKSEKEFAEKLAKSDADVADLKKSLDTVTKALEMVLRKPQSKVIRGKDVAVLAKSEPEAVDVSKLKRDQILPKLTELAKNPDLKKSDRTLINEYVGKRITADKLQVLFDKK